MENTSTSTATDSSALTESDLQKRQALRRMKGISLGLLLFAALVFIISFPLQGQYPWLGYVRAASEGAMVGALADWFAVTALFRHPLGLPIPHTAIIPNKKDAIGASLGEFVESNFLSESVVRQRLEEINLSQRIGSWLTKEGSAERVASEGANTISTLLNLLRDEDVRDVLEPMVRRYLFDPPWAPPIGRLAEQVLDAGHQKQLIDLLVDQAVDWVEANPEAVSKLVAERSPNWLPNFVDEMLGDRLYTEVHKFVLAVQADPNHPVRQAIDEYLVTLADDLQHDPTMIQRVEDVKAQLLDSPRVRELVGQTWDTLKTALLEATGNPDSELHRKFVTALKDFGNRLLTDQDLAAKVNGWLTDLVCHIVRDYRHDISSLITDTVERWDAQEASEKIELQVGKDLQYIRINGTIVGALAGLTIYTIATLLFH